LIVLAMERVDQSPNHLTADELLLVRRAFGAFRRTRSGRPQKPSWGFPSHTGAHIDLPRRICQIPCVKQTISQPHARLHWPMAATDPWDPVRSTTPFSSRTHVHTRSTWDPLWQPHLQPCGQPRVLELLIAFCVAAT
jgi:hypothetical protein